MEQQYEDLIKEHERIGLVLPENVFDHMKGIDDKTYDALGDIWKENAIYNLTHNLPKHGWINDGYINIGLGKAGIAIGAGPSLKRNEDILKIVSLADGTKPFEDQSFIFMASNHQIKPCLEKGIIPHFVLVADGSPDLAYQFDVGKEGKYTTLIATIHTHPDVISMWKGPVKFIMTRAKTMIDIVEEHTGKPFDIKRGVVGGGNILNLTFTISVGLFRTSVWMCVGNDLSFPRLDDVEDRRKGYYADGDYTTNTLSKRDEASREFAWMAFEFPDDQLISNVNYVNYNLVNTSPQLFIYKSWLESTALLAWRKGNKFTIYNCSESGILGVVLKETAQDPEKYDDKLDQDNWLLLDDIARNKWRTYKLANAVEEFQTAKSYLRSQLPYDTIGGQSAKSIWKH